MVFMYEFETTDGHTQALIPLTIKPHSHKAVPSITGNALSSEAGTVLYGHYNMEYLLPHGDKLRLIANHNEKTVQMMLFTHSPELIKLLPGERRSSLVADMINRIRRYQLRSESYQKPLTPAQEKKRELATECIKSLSTLLTLERALDCQDYKGHEELRRSVIALIEECRDGNRLIANNPVVSEGFLGSLLYDAQKEAQHFTFNRMHKVSSQDQMDFSHIRSIHEGKPPCFIWDSEIHIGHNDSDLDDTLRTICHYYHLNPAQELVDVPANRFEKVEKFLYQLGADVKDWINYFILPKKPTHKTEIYQRSDGVTITQIIPYYKFNGIPQKGYPSLNDLVLNITPGNCIATHATQSKHAKYLLNNQPNGSWVIVPEKSKIILRLEDKFVTLKYFIQEGQFYPLPDGQDLYTLSQISKRHLYLPERVGLKLKAFVSRIPLFFKNFYNSLGHFITHDLKNEFINHIHASHLRNDVKPADAPQSMNTPRTKSTLQQALENKGILANGQTIEEFIQEHLNQSPYVIARSNHPPSLPTYTNPFHRSLEVLRHFAGIFVDTSERNPIVGTLAMAAYVYGAGAVLAPDYLTSVLTKLHLSGLIAGIEPTQKLAHLMSHGPLSEAISASVTYWQGVVAGGNLDKFFVDAIHLFKDDPAGIAIIAALALSLGYGITQVIPSLQDEMGEFPFTNYAALGAKGGAAIYDTIMHPGDDWLLGSFKWLFKHGITVGKLFVAPFIEGAIYGFWGGFINGWKKSGYLAIKTIKQTIAATLDFSFALLTIPLLEISSILIHVPFRGLTNFISKILGTFGHISSLGKILIHFAERPSTNNFLSDFRFSTLYGFTSPFGHFSKNLFLNLFINLIRLIYVPLFQLIKNIVILPLIDFLSFTTRLCLTIINSVSRITAYMTGSTVYFFGTLWDHSIGLVFSTGSHVLTSLCNGIDNIAGSIKQTLLSGIQIIRNSLYHWAFHEEDLLIHHTVTDLDYFTTQPMRIEKIPHTDSHCLLHALLGENAMTKQLDKEDHHYTTLYKESIATLDLPDVDDSNRVPFC